MVVGSNEFSARLARLLTTAGHPVRTVSSRDDGRDAAAGARVVVVTDSYDADYCDRLNAGATDLRIIFAPPSIPADLEEEVALRENVRLRVASPNAEEFHALVHDILAPIPDARPRALPD